MKVLKIIIACLAGVYGIAQVLQLTIRLLGKTDTAYSQGALMGNIAGVFIGLAISVACFKSAFKKKEKES